MKKSVGSGSRSGGERGAGALKGETRTTRLTGKFVRHTKRRCAYNIPALGLGDHDLGHLPPVTLPRRNSVLASDILSKHNGSLRIIISQRNTRSSILTRYSGNQRGPRWVKSGWLLGKRSSTDHCYQNKTATPHISWGSPQDPPHPAQPLGSVLVRRGITIQDFM